MQSIFDFIVKNEKANFVVSDKIDQDQRPGLRILIFLKVDSLKKLCMYNIITIQTKRAA